MTKYFEEIEKNEIISLDGKTICGSLMDDYSFIHMVSTWANQTGILMMIFFVLSFSTNCHDFFMRKPCPFN